MKITGILISKTDRGTELAQALSPDNGGYIKCSGSKQELTAEIAGTSPRTVLASVDDYLMNLSVAWQIQEQNSANQTTTTKTQGEL